jgi:hypothetical protein
VVVDSEQPRRGGDVYTEKQKIPAIIIVDRWRIEGDLHILSQSRLTDALNSKTKDFLAVTDAKVFDSETGSMLFESPFLDVNRASIAIVLSR